MHLMKERGQTTAGLILLCEKNDTLTEILARREPRMLVGGKNIFCRVWRDTNETVICNKCITVGHSTPE
jgi:hypothetical protein